MLRKGSEEEGLGETDTELVVLPYLVSRLHFCLTSLFLDSRMLSSHCKESISVNIKTAGSYRLTCLFYYTFLFGKAGWQGGRFKHV